MKNIKNRGINKKVRWVYSLMVVSMLMPMLTFSLPAEATDSQIDICHATGNAHNPYTEITVDKNAWNGHNSTHDGDFVREGDSCLGSDLSAYCGDDKKNQDWEQCDGEENCTDQCQFKEPNECSDLVLARVNVNEFKNLGDGDMSSNIYLGTSDYSIPAGTWFVLYKNGSFINDADIGGYENVPGLAVQRLAGSVRVVLFGSTTEKDKEHINGNIEFYNATVTDQRDDIATDDVFEKKSNRLENDDNGTDYTVKGTMTLSATDDEVWLENNNNTQSFFWLTTTTADDGYYTDWSIVEDCKDETGTLKICKQEDLNGDGVLDNGEPVVFGWDFIVDGQTTYNDNDDGTLDGCATIDLPYGIYNIDEVLQSGWSRTGTGGNGIGQLDGSVDITISSSGTYIIYFMNQEDPISECPEEDNLLTNGSFEEPVVTNGSLWQKFSSVFDWIIEKVSDNSATTLELHKGWSGNNAAEGLQYSELDGDHSTHISQDVVTEEGAEYKLFWSFAARHNIPVDQNQLSVKVNGTQVATNGPATGSAPLAQDDWTQSNYVFTADSINTKLAFEDIGSSNSYGTYLDDVRLCKIADPEPKYDPYCGDGKVNQDWEQCDSGNNPELVGCSVQCQFIAPSQKCSDLTLAKVNIKDVQNWGNGDMTNDLFLGSASYKIPNDVWFAVYWKGLYFTDPDIASYEEVEGLAVQRLKDSVRTVMYGTGSGDDKEHVSGHVEFYNATLEGQRSDESNDNPGNNRLEKGFDGNGVDRYNASNDEVWEKGEKSMYWLTTTTADDGYYTDWSIIEDCEDDTSICGVKFFDHNQDGEQGGEEENLSDWTITLQSKLQCEDGDEWADEVVEYNPGSGVVTERSDSAKALGVAEDNDTLNFVSLGKGGELVLRFDNLIENGVGDDIQIIETSWNNPSCDKYPEYVHVYASQDGSDGSWTDLGRACQFGDPSFDLGLLPWAQYVKLVDETNSTPDGFDVDGVRAINCLNAGEVIGSEVTTENGYCFEDLEDGHYMVCEELLEDENTWINITPLCQQVEINELNLHATVDFGNYQEKQEPTTGDICVVKFNDKNQNGGMDDNESGIFGWDFELTKFLETVEVDAKGSIQSTTVDIEVGKTYLLVAEGTYTYINNKTTSGFADAEWSDRPDFSYGPGWKKGEAEFSKSYGLDVMVDDTNLDWGDYESSHVYNYVYTAVNTSIKFQIKDNNYSDNYTTEGDPIRVSIYELVEGTTEEGGEYCFTDLEFGEYEVSEIMKPDWFNSTPVTQSVSLDVDNTPVTVYFGNYQEHVGDSICGYKYEVDEAGKHVGVLGAWPMSLWSATEVFDFTVDANDNDGVTHDFTFKSGKTYKIEVTGTAWAGDTIDFDAKYSLTNRIDVDTWTDVVSGYKTHGTELLDLQINGVSPDWGAYNEEHTYFIVKEGDNSNWNFTIHDIYPTNNSGSLAVVVYELTDTGKAESTNDNGWYCFEDLESGHYVVQEGSQENYSPYGSEYCQIADTSALEENSCDFYNYEEPVTTGIITVCKYESQNDDSGAFNLQDKSVPYTNGWLMTVKQDGAEISGKTGAAGCVDFELEAGTYEVHEADYTNWTQSWPQNLPYYQIVLGAGETKYADFFNRSPNDEPPGECTENCGRGRGTITLTFGCIDITLTPLSLDGGPVVYNPGGKAKFQITITNNCSGIAHNALIKNILPPGFTFSVHGGASTAAVSISSNLSMAAVSSDATTQDWDAGDLAPGASWSTIYDVDIDSSVVAGSYMNMANVQIDGDGDTAFDEDEVPVLLVEPVVQGFEYEDPEVQVLGYTELPDTGGPAVKNLMMNFMLLFGLIMIAIGTNLYLKQNSNEA